MRNDFERGMVQLFNKSYKAACELRTGMSKSLEEGRLYGPDVMRFGKTVQELIDTASDIAYIDKKCPEVKDLYDKIIEFRPFFNRLPIHWDACETGNRLGRIRQHIQCNEQPAAGTDTSTSLPYLGSP